MSPTDIITITDDPNRLTATRRPDTSADQFNLWTSSAALDGGLGVDSTKTSRRGAGTVQSGARRPGRELTIGGVWFGPGQAAAVGFIDTLTAIGDDGRAVDVRRTTGVGVRWCTARLDGDPKVTPVVEDDWARVEWELPLYAEDPHFYGAERTVQVTTPGADYGLVWPLFDPAGLLDWGVDGPGGTGVLANAGRAEAWPVAVVSGNAASGFRLGDGLGHWVVYRGAVTEQAPVRLDFAAGSASQGGDRTQLVTGRGWWSVPPGGRVQPVVESLQQGTTCRCDITIYDTYI